MRPEFDTGTSPVASNDSTSTADTVEISTDTHLPLTEQQQMMKRQFVIVAAAGVVPLSGCSLLPSERGNIQIANTNRLGGGSPPIVLQ